MKNIEFAEIYGYLNHYSDGIKLIKLNEYQKGILNNLEDESLPKTIIDSDRQSGVTIALAIHISHFLLGPVNKKNTIVIKSVNSQQSIHLLNKVRFIVDQFRIQHYSNQDEKLFYLSNNKSEIELRNGNRVIISNNIEHLRGEKTEKIHTLLIDNASYVKNLDDFIDQFVRQPKMDVKKIIIASTHDGYHIVVKKPPLGLASRKIWLEEVNKVRLEEIKKAIKRYLESDMEIPTEWIKELNKLIKK